MLRWNLQLRLAAVKCTRPSAVSALGLTVQALAVHMQDAELTARPAEIQAWDDTPENMRPIFVRETVRERAQFRNVVPEQQRSRLLSVRAFDAEGWMLDADVTEGALLEASIARFFGNASVAYLHVHNARRGCYACRVDRG